MSLKKICEWIGCAIVTLLFGCFLLVPVIGTLVFVGFVLDYASHGSRPGHNDLEGIELIPVAIVAFAFQMLVSFTTLYLIVKGLS